MYRASGAPMSCLRALKMQDEDRKYKASLNLPKTAFPMRAKLGQREPLTLRRWQEQDIYACLRAERAGRRRFILHDGPPYANGAIHIGHAINKILKDFVVKLHGLDGEDASYVPGWDCHGLPIELVVEKKWGRPGTKLSAAEFRSACRDYATAQWHSQRQDFQRLGVLGDWQRPYLTMAHATEAASLRALGRILAAGHLSRGDRPVHWCLDCASALAEAEVEYREQESPAVDVRFDVLEPEIFASRTGVRLAEPWPVTIPIWTTTPWTLPANHAVALHPDWEYAVFPFHASGEACWMVLATDLAEAFYIRSGCAVQAPLAQLASRSLENLLLQHPFYDRQVPVLLSRHVTLELGTGAVHIAPGHGWDDYLLGRQHGLPIDNPVADNGCFKADTLLFAGEHVSRANARVIDVLKRRKRLLCHAVHRHSYPHCWRHRTPLIFRATPQWFVGMGSAKGEDIPENSLRGRALAAIDAVTWYPDWGRERMRGMVEERPDWCISRQRAWGVPIAFFVHQKTGALHPRSEALLERVAQQVEKQGVEVWFALDPESLIGKEAAEYEKLTDTLDVWFDSGVTHSTVLDTDERLAAPADLYLEGSDQYRGWFQSSLLSSLAMKDAAPYRSVLTHGFAVDAAGMKMSKSRGNVLAPQQVIRELGADILRLWVMATDYRSEMHVSDEILQRIAEAYRKIRNTVRYLLANLHDFSAPTQSVAEADMLQLDRWAMIRAACVQALLRQAGSEYQFHKFYHALYQFCVVDMSSFYLNVNKDRMYTLPKHSLERRSAQTAMFHILEALVRWLAPVLSFTAEEIWNYLPDRREASVLLATWHEDLPDPESAPARRILDDWRCIRMVAEVVTTTLEGLRSKGQIGSSLDAEVSLFCEGQSHACLQALQERDELRFVLLTSATDLFLSSQSGNHRDEDAVHLETELSSGEQLVVKVRRSRHKKCVRCWHLRSDVGGNSTHPSLCARCVLNVDGPGEHRVFV